MGQANFERFMSDLAPLQGKRFKGPDQVAMQARERMSDRNGPCCAVSWTPPTDAEVKQREDDWHAVGVMDKRKLRGGQTFRKGDLIAE